MSDKEYDREYFTISIDLESRILMDSYCKKNGMKKGYIASEAIKEYLKNKGAIK